MDAGLTAVNQWLDCVEGRLHEFRNHKYSNIMAVLTDSNRSRARLHENA